MPFEINAQFRKFVQFAQKQADGETVARTSPAPVGEGAFAGHTVMAAPGGRIAAFRRNGQNKARNNETRNLFRQSVNDIFGGAQNVPANVREAMQLSDYDNQGKPLTVRRILAVQTAILKYRAMMAVDHSLDYIDELLLTPAFSTYTHAPVTLAPASRQEAVRIAARFGRNMSEEGFRILASYVSIAAARRGYDPETVARDIVDIIGAVRNIRKGEERLAAVERQVLARAQELLEGELSRAKEELFDRDGVFGGFKEGGPCNTVIAGGKELPVGPEAAEAFKAKVRPEHRKALSLFFSRMDNSPVVAMSKRAAPYDEAMKLPGAELFVSFDTSGGSCFETWPVEVADPKRSIAVSEDGKSATLTVETPARLKFGLKGSNADSTLPTGDIAWEQEYVFDLGGPGAVLAGARIGQELKV